MRLLTPIARRAALTTALLASTLTPGSGQEATPSATPHRDILATEKKLYSLGKEELIIRDFFQDRTDGFFLDVGCAWPIKENNTYYLEKHLGWTGIAVDGLPDYARPWRKRKGSKFFNYMVTDHSGTVESFYRGEQTDISSIRPENENVPKAKYEEIKVPTITLTKLLEDNGVSKVDFLSMDIEGAEGLALAGFDIARFKPQLVCVEARAANRPKILEYFAAHGYEQIQRYLEHDQVNYYFTPKAK
jgi:FkbM family methyltransferase